MTALHAIRFTMDTMEDMAALRRSLHCLFIVALSNPSRTAAKLSPLAAG